MEIKSLLFCVMLLQLSNLCFSQVGRHELPQDTTPIGGEEQERKTIQMEGREQLVKDIVSLRDSVSFTITDMNKRSSNVVDVDKQRFEQASHDLARFKTQLDYMLQQLRSEQWGAEMNEQSQLALQEVRQGYNRIRRDLREK